MDQRKRISGRAVPQWELDVSDERGVLGPLADISLHGAKVLAYRDLVEGCEVKLQIALPTDVGLEELLCVQAVCRWSRATALPGRYDLGFEFNQRLSANQRHALAELVYLKSK